MKLCDFGVAIRLKDDLSGLKNPGDRYIGTEPWKCKEALKGGVITDKADIFTYGPLIWEMLALNVPHVDLLAGKTNINFQSLQTKEFLNKLSDGQKCVSRPFRSVG